jgi:hypothetical protein
MIPKKYESLRTKTSQKRRSGEVTRGREDENVVFVSHWSREHIVDSFAPTRFRR